MKEVSSFLVVVRLFGGKVIIVDHLPFLLHSTTLSLNKDGENKDPLFASVLFLICGELHIFHCIHFIEIKTWLLGLLTFV
jgi:hypothetical protein